MSETSQETMQSLCTSSAEDSPVKTSPWPDTRPDWTVRDPDFSMRCRESFATLDRKSGSWKTSQISLFSDFQTFSERWPTAGIMRGGDVFEHPTWEHHTTEIAGSVSPGTWPTPQKFEGQMDKNLEWYEERAKTLKVQKSLQVEAQRYCTPDLREQGAEVRRWPTPTKSDHKGSSKPGQRKGQLSEATEPGYPGRLNPEWVEMLMGFPPGWTSLDIGGQSHQGHSPQESLPDSITDTPQTNRD